MNEKLRIFCIGPNKTGTSSLHLAFKMLGFKSLHNPYLFNRRVLRAFSKRKKILYYLDKYNAFSDIFFPSGVNAHPFLSYRNIENFLKKIEEDYSNVKFILNIRNMDDWIRSREKHVKINLHNKFYRGNWKSIDVEKWKDEMNMIQSKVKNYFIDKPDKLLIIDVCNNCDWEELCIFLNKPIPDKPFPHANKFKSSSFFSRTLKFIRKIFKII